MKSTPTERRRRELAKIHLAVKQLGMDDSTYRDLLQEIVQVRSAKDLDERGRRQVLDHLQALGFKSKASARFAGRPRNITSDDRGPQLAKIEAMLAAAARPWAYVDGMAKKMFQVDRVGFCNPEQLRKIIAALTYDAKRHGRLP